MNNNIYNDQQYNSSTKMESTTGRLIKIIFLIIILVVFLAPFYLMKMVDDHITEENVNTETIIDTNNSGTTLYVNEFINTTGGPTVYSSVDLTYYEVYEKGKTYEIKCQTKKCYRVSKDVLYENGPFIFFIDGNKLGFYDINRETIIDYFEGYTYEDNFYFISDEGININPDFFFIKKNQNKYAIYDVEKKILSEEYDINEIMSGPYGDAINGHEIEPFFRNHVLVYIDGKYKVLNYTTGIFLTDAGYEEVNCDQLYLINSGEEVMSCDFINDDTKLITEASQTKENVSLFINDINDINYSVDDYKITSQNDKLSIFNSDNKELYKINLNTNDKKFYKLEIVYNASESSINLLTKSDNLEDNQCYVTRYSITYDSENFETKLCE